MSKLSVIHKLDIKSAPLPVVYERATAAISECVYLDECKEWSNKAAALASYARQAADDELEQMCKRIRARAIRRCGILLKMFDGQGKRNDLELRVGADPKLTKSDDFEYDESDDFDPKPPKTWKCYDESKLTREPCDKCDIQLGDGIWECLTCGYGVAPYDPDDPTHHFTKLDAGKEAGLSERQIKQANRLANIPEDDFDKLVEQAKVPTVTELSEQGKRQAQANRDYLAKPKPEGFAEAIQFNGSLNRLFEFADMDPQFLLNGMNERDKKETISTIFALIEYLKEFGHIKSWPIRNYKK